jgi:hypothetical protein
MQAFNQGNRAMSELEQAKIKRDELATALTAATRARKDAEQAERTVRADYEASCVQYGKIEGHPLAHKNVARKAVRRGSYDIGFRGTKNPDRTVTERGVVTLAGLGRVAFRGHHPQPGEWFVLTASGNTAYKLSEEWELEA